jgi:AcrR family transcriptional regulator
MWQNGVMGQASLRERKRIATVERIEQTAAELFLRRGYDAVTVADIAAAAEVAPRTFFRYFQAKEEVLFGRDAEILELALSAIAKCPPGQPLLATIRSACEEMISWTERHEEIMRKRQAILRSSTMLSVREAGKRALLDQAAAAALGDLVGASREDPRPLLYSRIASACYDAAIAAWLTDDIPLRAGLGAAFAALPGATD